MATVHVRRGQSNQVNANEEHDFILHEEHEGAVIIYGRGGELGDFRIFAEWLVKRDLKAKYGDNIVLKNIRAKREFFSFLANTNFAFRINELHIFSHAFGPGLSLAYEDPVAVHEREEWVRHNLDRYYREDRFDELYDAIIESEKTILFFDDLLLLAPDMRHEIGSKFDRNDSDAFIKIWGCNAGVERWNYDPTNSYWGSLNRKNNPKPSIARIFAETFNVLCYGALSGSHIEVLHDGKWVRSDDYAKQTHRNPSPQIPHRLTPDRGDYVKYTP